MSYESPPSHCRQRGFGIASFDENGGWVNAVARNTGGTKKFVAGPVEIELWAGNVRG